MEAEYRNIKDLPKDFTASVEVLNHNVTRKSMYLTMEDGAVYRSPIPKYMDSHAIDGTTQHFTVRGISTLELAPEQTVNHLSMMVPESAKASRHDLVVGTKFTNGTYIKGIDKAFGMFIYCISDSTIDSCIYVPEIKVLEEYTILPELTLSDLIAKREVLMLDFGCITTQRLIDIVELDNLILSKL